MTESELPDFEHPSKFDDPESHDRGKPHPRQFDINDDDQDDDEDRPVPRRSKRYNTYAKYFTPEERKMLDAIPDNDVSYEINLMLSLLIDTFALVSTEPKDQKPPLTP